MGYYSEQIRIDIKGKYTKDYSAKKLIKYIIYENYKDDSGSKHTGSEVGFYGGYGVSCTDAETMSRDMEKIRKHYKKNSRQKILSYHNYSTAEDSGRTIKYSGKEAVQKIF